MENILRKLAEAKGPQYTDTLKRQFLQKILGNLSNSELSPEDSTGLFTLFLEWILASENPLLVEFGHKYLGTLSECNPDLFHDFVNPNLCIEIIANSCHHSDRVEVIRAVGQILDLLKELPPPSRGGDQRRSVVNVTKAHLFTFLREQGIHLPVASAISALYQSHPEVLPPSSEWSRLAVLVVKLLAGYRLPQQVEGEANEEQEEAAKEEFFRETAEVSKMLPLVWGRSDDTDGVEECLKAFYVIISTEESYSKPSCALINIIDKVPRQFLDVSTKAILEESGQQQGEAKTVIALQTMIEWLTQHPNCRVLSQWIQQMLQGLQKNDKNSVLIEIAHSSTEKLLLSLSDPRQRPSVEPILFFLLLGFQHSESVFHAVVAHLPKTLRTLRKSAESPAAASAAMAMTTLGRLAEASHFLMTRFPNFPELYDPVVEALDELGLRAPSEPRRGELRTLSWLSPLHSTAFVNQSGLVGKNRRCSLVDEALAYRSETGMVGLINLGNTCYMNSVLQALFISKDFCEGVLQSPLTASQNVLLRLQQSFAFLKLSQRSIYSPAELLRVARPPWFEPGRQQDCSEFLRYLLDTLHEQERNGAGPKAAVTYGEHKIIESPATPSSTTSSASSSATLSATPTPNGGGGGGGEEEDSGRPSTASASSSSLSPVASAAKVSSASNLALDVISEAPENDDDARGDEDEDEEMMSQDGRMDEDYFGSRGSLSAVPPSASSGGAQQHQSQQQQQAQQQLPGRGQGGSSSRGGSRVALNLMEDDDEDEETDLGGSRTSLGSGIGLKRWTTEENLSSIDGGSREGKMDLLDGPIHDSHSNSRDSGIQSVGDSIRGSSDSMGNPQPMDTSAGGATAATGAARPGEPVASNPEFRNQKCAPPPSVGAPFLSLVQEVFGGKMQTSYTCYTCRSVSLHRDMFTELHLAIPEATTTTVEAQKVTSGTEGAMSETSGKDKGEEKEIKTATPTLCLPTLPEGKGNPQEDPLTMQSLVHNYLASEVLEGDNKYHCDKCGGLRDAEKTVKILEGPQYLICTLLRFKYDRAINRKSKVFTDVDYRLGLELPIEPGAADGGSGGGEEEGQWASRELYSLYGVVVHSGYSSDGGHYYTYAREPKLEEQGEKEEEVEAKKEVVGEAELQQEEEDADVWYIFNDSKVSFATFEAFKTVSKRFPRDAAYQLFYRKLPARRRGQPPGTEPAQSTVTSVSGNSSSSSFSSSRRPLRADLKMAVEKDNLKFLREKERSASGSSSSTSSWTQYNNKRWDDDSRGGGGGGGSGGGCGGGGFNSPGRLVC